MRGSSPASRPGRRPRLQGNIADDLEITGKRPGYLSSSAGVKFAGVLNGMAAISKGPAAGWGLILAYRAFCETSQD